MSDHKNKVSRRDLLKAAGIAGLGLTASGVSSGKEDDYSLAGGRRRGVETMIGVKFDPHDVVRLGIVGVGYVARARLGNSWRSTKLWSTQYATLLMTSVCGPQR
jgi:hypothetical protein